jgi:hypothetical protein
MRKMGALVKVHRIWVEILGPICIERDSLRESEKDSKLTKLLVLWPGGFE